MMQALDGFCFYIHNSLSSISLLILIILIYSNSFTLHLHSLRLLSIIFSW